MGQKTFFSATVLCLAATAISCTRFTSTPSAQTADQASNSIGCPSFKDDFWDAVYAPLVKNQDLPKEIVFQNRLNQVLSERYKLKAQDQEEILNRITELYSVIRDSGQTLTANGEPREVLATLTALELGDRSSPEKLRLQIELKNKFQSVQDYAQSLSLPCQTPPPPSPSPSVKPTPSATPLPTPGETPSPSSTPLPSATIAPSPSPTTSPSPQNLLSYWKATLPPAAYGARKTIAVSYQSCQATAVTPMNAQTPDVQGISVIGTYPDGIGSVRAISNRAALIASNYFFQGYQNPGTSCVDVRLNPLIYSYGGKPYTDSTAGAKLDFFTSAGTGNPHTLGVDCSGFVFSALASAGLKLTRAERLKAISVQGVSSTFLRYAAANGLDCLAPVTFRSTQSMQSGDIMAISGHVVIVDDVGADPFGLSQIANVTACSSQVSYQNFNFTILQSSPSKGGMGINRYRAVDYLGETAEIRIPFEDFAKNACQAKFSGSQIAQSSNGSLLRHQSSDPQCVDNEVKLVNEECLSACPAK